MFSAFFIRRPIFATVLSIIITLMGLAAMRSLPVAQFPQILPPEITVRATYPGASAEVVADTVAAPLEQQINGATGMIYMSSTSSSDGRVSLRVTFATGTDPDDALIEVNNRIQAAVPTLPEEVRRLGVVARKATSDILAVTTLAAPDGRFDEIYISNYALLNLVEELKRVPGVGDARLFGLKYYAMRVWLDPQRMNTLGLVPSDVAQALRDQNAQLPAGRIGSEPLETPVDFTFTMTTQGRLLTPETFGDVVLRRGLDGAVTRLRDVARVELGAQDYSFTSSLNGQMAVPMGIFLQPGANALATMDRVNARLQELSTAFPEGLEYRVPYDTTRFVRISIEEVVKTLFEAFLLVFGVVFLFLGNWRATLIPSLAVPVSLIGTFAGMYLLGFTINTLTLFGMVLAIGIVVDDAIVVLENVERIMEEEGLDARAATFKAMQQVTGPVVAIVLVLAAVFLPVAFLGGLSGVLYKQFAITIAVSVAISGVVALTLTPALCALFLRSGHQTRFAPLVAFNRGFRSLTERYVGGVGFLLRHTAITVALFVAVLLGGLLMFRMVPGALLPDEDQGTVIAAITLPDASSLSRTESTARQLSDYLSGKESVSTVVGLVGFNLLAGSLQTNAATLFVSLSDWSERETAADSSKAIAAETAEYGFNSLRDAKVLGINPPPIRGLSTTGGFEFYIESRASADYAALADQARHFADVANADPRLSGVLTTFAANTPRIRLQIDRDKAAELGISLTGLFEAAQATFGTLYVNDFNRDGRAFQVIIQAEGEARDTIEDLRGVNVRAAGGDLVPLTTVVTPVQETGPELVDRFNSFPAVKMLGNPAAGVSSGTALAALAQVAEETLDPGYTLAWTGSAYQEQQIGDTAAFAFVAGLLMVFLILAAQYERWSLPFAVVLSVPFALLGALSAVALRGLSNDIYFQVGLVTLIGLSAKNAILIVEFAALNARSGMNTLDAALLAARQRFRPVVMTSLAFIFGVIPLALSSGAGSAARHSIGTGVIGGMVASTLLATLFIPAFFRWVYRHSPQDPAPTETRE
ncbi:multidrug efflux RND transporter permease subunit [Flagellatimonas centrodinii]|uniref:efflux RND transporter permease subunit n=1 Tax=Flagellatimonas centrodinii TaxID=2806210 RepID=UPI001FFDAE62|nr:multidrug efflux RND transporter permease subunit [Flagellatimonas centrodinii]ULQ46595.1 multidrug efflux RND transporter permease subunit [Flagellatimonas centrodinii]